LLHLGNLYTFHLICHHYDALSCWATLSSREGRWAASEKREMRVHSSRATKGFFSLTLAKQLAPLTENSFCITIGISWKGSYIMMAEESSTFAEWLCGTCAFFNSFWRRLANRENAQACFWRLDSRDCLPYRESLYVQCMP
jgi:hypothetical protein